MSEQEESGEATLWPGEDEGTTLHHYRTLANTIDDGIYQLDAEGRFVAVNDVVVERLGYAREEIVGHPVSLILDDADIERVEDAIRRLLASDDDAAMLELSVRTADGGSIVCEVRLSLLVVDGEFRGTVGVARDVTDRRRREEESRRERALLDRVFESSPIGICVLAPDGEIIAYNDRAGEIVGAARDDRVGDVYEPSEWEAYDESGDPLPPEERAFARVVRTCERVSDHVMQVDRADGGRVWLSCNGAPVFDADGELSLVVLTYEDVTDRKEDERKLRRERAQTEKLLKTAPVAVVVHDADGNVVMANERAQTFLGLSETEIIEEPDDVDEWALYDASGAPLSTTDAPVARVLATGEPVFNEELAIERPSGERRWFRVNATPVFGPDGALERVISAGEDITELKLRERQLERRKSELETELGEILGRISDAFYALDEEYRFTHVNERAEQLLQHSREELLGETLWDEFPEAADEETVRDAFREAVASQAPRSFEFYFDSLGFWVEANLYPSETGVSVYFRDITERKAREQELTQYEAIVETINDGIYVVDEDGRFTMVNAAYAELTGYAREELVGEHVSLVVDEDVLREAERTRAQMLEDRSSNPVLDGELETKSGERIPVEATFASLPNGDGSQRRIGVVRNITERKDRERALEESERRYRTLLDHFPNGAVGLYDEDLRYTVAGGEMFANLGLSHEDVLGSTVYERYPREIVEEVEPYFHAALAGDASTFEVEYRGRNLLAHTLPVRDAGGDILAGMLMTQDITERKAQERRLREREQRLERYKEYTDDVLNAIDDVFYILDEAGNLRRWNQSLCEVSGHSDDEIKSMHAVGFFHENARDDVLSAIRDGFETGHARLQADLLTRDGSLVPYEFVGAALDDPEGNAVLAVIGRDITERKEAQRRLEESNERLEQFAYAASHDLQEPLRMVSSYLSLVERRYRDDLDEDGREFIEFAVDGAERMRDMIDALLQYSRVETRGDEFETVDLDAVVDDARKNLEMRIAETDADVSVEPLPRVEGDPNQLRQVFQNLLSNAVEYSGDDPPEVRVSADRVGSYWRIAVRDEGVGIDPAHAERIFEVFQRLHTHDEHAGTGIGLALCERIVERHGGRIWVDSEPGEGSTFYFTIPATEARR
jgi:PAS domain S-box-containing protein